MTDKHSEKDAGGYAEVAINSRPKTELARRARSAEVGDIYCRGLIMALMKINLYHCKLFCDMVNSSRANSDEDAMLWFFHTTVITVYRLHTTNLEPKPPCK